MEENMPVSKDRINFKIIDWMRGLAALYVVINHSRGQLFTTAITYADHVKPKAQWGIWEWANIMLMQHTGLGVEFVILFFLLSGFSIAHSLNDNSNTTAFYGRRLIRLYPTYIIGIVWAIVVFLIIKIAAPAVFYTTTEGQPPLNEVFQKFISVKSMLLNFFYIPTNNYLSLQYWSLPYEIIFYLVVPWVIKKMRWYGIITIFLFTFFWVFLGSYYPEMLNTTVDHIVFNYLVIFNFFFFVGILFYQYRNEILARFKLSKKMSIVLLLILFETIVITKAYLMRFESNKLTSVMMMVFSFVLIFSGLKYNIRIKPLEKIGAYSYTLYVTHYATIALVNLLAFRMGLHYYNIDVMYIWYLGVPVSLLCAYLLYFIAEKPSTTYLQKLRAKRKQAV